MLRELQWLLVPDDLEQRLCTEQTDKNRIRTCWLFLIVITFPTAYYMLREGSPHYTPHVVVKVL